MLYLALALKLSFTSLTSPLSCLFQLFHFPLRDKKTEEVLGEEKKEVPKNVEEMIEFIRILKQPQV